MLALVHFSCVFEVAVIKGVREESRHVDTGKRFAVLCADSMLCEKLPHVVEVDLATRVGLEGLFDDGSTFVIDDDRLRPVIVQVSNRSRPRIFPAPHFLAQSTFRVLGKGIDVVLALPEHDGEHELALRVGFKAEGGEPEGSDLPRIEKIYDLSSIDTVPRQSVRMPSQYPVRLTFLDSGEHITENRPTWLLRRLLLDEFSRDAEAFTGSKFPQLMKLGID